MVIQEIKGPGVDIDELKLDLQRIKNEDINTQIVTNYKNQVLVFIQTPKMIKNQLLNIDQLYISVSIKRKTKYQIYVVQFMTVDENGWS